MMPEQQIIQYTDGMPPKPPSNLHQTHSQSHKSQKNKNIYLSTVTHSKRKEENKNNTVSLNVLPEQEIYGAIDIPPANVIPTTSHATGGLRRYSAGHTYK
jgi:hypothetical protein